MQYNNIIAFCLFKHKNIFLYRFIIIITFAEASMIFYVSLKSQVIVITFIRSKLSL